MRRIAISAEALADDAVRDMQTVPKSAQVHADLLAAMRSSPLFESLQPELLASIIDSMEANATAAGDVVIQQGDPGEHLYVVESGVYDAFVRIGTNGEEKKVSEFGKGQSFGELALLYNSPRAATIRTREAGVCYMLNRSVFQHLVKGYSTK
jgi:CRP-like cAMP-binding protein